MRKSAESSILLPERGHGKQFGAGGDRDGAENQEAGKPYSRQRGVAQDEDGVVERQDARGPAQEVLAEAELSARPVREVAQRDQEPREDEEDADAHVTLSDHHLQPARPRLEVEDEDQQCGQEPERMKHVEVPG